MPRISIEFDTNAKSVAKQVKDLENVLSDINRKGSGRRRAVSQQSRTAITSVADEINRADLTRPGSQNVIRAANRAGLGTQIENTAMMAGTMIGGVLGKELQQGIGYLVNENMRPIKQAIARLREQAASSTNPAIAANITKTADDLQAQLSAYQEMAVSRKSALQSLQEPRVLENLERLRSQYNRLGLDVGSVGDLGKFAAQLSTVSPGVAGAISTLTANVDNLDPQEYAKQFQRIASEGLKQVDSQKRELEAAITRQTSRGDRRIGTSFTRVFEERFGKVADFISGAATFDKTSLPNQMAMSVFRDQIKSTAPRSILSQLDARNISQVQALTSARAGGDPAQVATALANAEKAIQRRIRAVQEDLTKLSKIAEASGDRDLKAAINKLRISANEAQQKLLNQVTGAQRTIQQGMFRQLDASLKTFTDSVGGAGGDRATITTRQGLLDYNNRLTGYIGDLFQSTNKAFANVQFQSLGGQSLAQMFPGKGGGLGARANFLTNQVLAPTGFFSETTAEGRMSALSQAIDQVEPRLQALGLNGKELSDAAEQLRAVLLRVMKAYEPVIRTADRLNAVQFEAARARAERAIATGDYDGARAAITDLQNYTTTAVPTSRRSLLTNEAQLTAQAVGDLSPRGLTNYQENIDRIERDIERAESRANRDGLFARIGRFAGRALSIFGGLQFAIGGTAAAIGGLVEQASALDRAAATVNALSGSFEGFSRVLTLAATQQAKFGGTLEQNLQGFNSLIPISKRYGADLLQLDNIARRLAVIDPLQGFQGASIALKEFFSGDITSLSRRFEIDRKTLNSIKDAGNQLEQLQRLDEVLADLGISNAVLESRTQTTAATYDQFGATLSNFTTLLGKSLQTGYAGLTEALTNTINYTNELNQVLSKEQAYINLTTNIERVARKLVDLENTTVELEDPIREYSGDFVNLDGIVSKNVKSVEELRQEFNELITQLNRLRGTQGKPLLTLFQTRDYEVIEDLVDISNRTGTPVISLLEERNPVTGSSLTAQEAGLIAARRVNLGEDLLAAFTGYETESVRRRNELEGLTLTRYSSGILSDVVRGALGPLISKAFQPELLNQYFAQSVTRQRGQGPRGRSEFLLGAEIDQLVGTLNLIATPYLEQLRLQTELLNTNTQFYGAQAEILRQQTGVNYTKQAAEYANQLQYGNLSQEEANSVVIKLIELNKKLLEVTEARVQYESDYITQNLASASSFGGQSLNEVIVGKLNEITKQNADMALQVLAQAYDGMGGGASATGMSAELQKLVKYAQEYYGITREQLYYQSQLERQQAKITLEADKSVSAYTALRNQMTGLQVPLQEAVRLAMEFNGAIQSMVSGMISDLDPTERLNFFLSEFSNPYSMQSQGDIVDNMGNALGALRDVEQARLDAQREANQESQDLAKDHNNEMTDLAEEYQEDRADLLAEHQEKVEDLLEDYEKEKLKLLEEYEEKKLQLLKDSEISKRDSRAGFYNTLMRTDSLTPEQMQQASADYETLFQEASDLRAKGEFGKAEAVLATGTEEILNRVRNQEEIAQETEKIKEAEEDIAELRKDLAKAESPDERARIEKRIREVEEEKAQAQERIQRYQGVYKLIAVTDAERVKQARESEEQITKDLNDELADRKKALDEDLEEAELALKESLDDREEQYKKSLERIEKAQAESLSRQSKADDEATKAEILNMEDIVQIRKAGYLAIDAARLAATGASRESIETMLTAGMAPIREYFLNRKTPASEIILESLDQLEKLPPGMQQRYNPALGAALSQDTNNPFLNEMARAGISAPEVTIPGAITPFEAAIINNKDAVVLNTTAVSTLTTAFTNFTRWAQNPLGRQP